MDDQDITEWFVQLLESNLSENNDELIDKIIFKIKSNVIDKELDFLLRELENVIPYNLIIPTFRDHVKLSIQSDEECTKTLNSFKSFINKDNEILILLDKLIEYINSEEGDLDIDIIPEIDLMCLLEFIPTENTLDIYNCIEYISNNSE